MAKKNNLHFIKGHNPSKTNPRQASRPVNSAYQDRQNRNQKICKVSSQYTKATCKR